MASCIFLFPNALLTKDQAASLGDNFLPNRLQQFCCSTDEPAASALFANPQLSGLAALQWIWMLITRRSTLVPTAPYLWKGLGGLKSAQELWELSAYHCENNRLLGINDPFDLDEECFLMDLLSRLVQKYGFQLQTLNGRFFLVRKKAWDVQITPWIVQNGKQAAEAVGSDAEQWRQLQEEIRTALINSELNRYRIDNQRTALDGLWISGGGFEEQILPFSLLRSVQCNDPTVKGIAMASGIPKTFITDEYKSWPDCPEGDRLTVFSEFNRTEIRSDAQKWVAAWDKALDQVEHLLGTAQGLEPYDPVFVATDGLKISRLQIKKRPKILNLFSKENSMAELWLKP